MPHRYLALARAPRCRTQPAPAARCPPSLARTQLNPARALVHTCVTGPGAVLPPATGCMAAVGAAYETRGSPYNRKSSAPARTSPISPHKQILDLFLRRGVRLHFGGAGGVVAKMGRRVGRARKRAGPRARWRLRRADAHLRGRCAPLPAIYMKHSASNCSFRGCSTWIYVDGTRP